MRFESLFVYILLGVAVFGLLLWVAEDLTEVFSSMRAPLGERVQRVLDLAVARTGSAYTGVQAVIQSPELGKWSGAAGTASNLGQELMTSEHQFGIGSISKTFVATVILQLMEEGRIHLDSPIGAYLPEDVVAGIPYGGKINVRMLLNHTSGIAEWTTLETDIQTAEDQSFVWNLEHVLDLAAKHEPLFQPGEEHSYSNTNYNLLGLIVEQLTGNWWGDEVTRRILDPLELESTIVRAPGDTEIPMRMARGYVQFGDEPIDVTEADPSMAGAAGGNSLVSTTSDLAAFLHALLHGRLFSNPDTLEAMLSWHDAPDDNGFPYWYGLGIEKYHVGDVVLIGHAGGAVGFSTVMYSSPDTDLTIVASHNALDVRAAYVELLLPMLNELGR